MGVDYGYPVQDLNQWAWALKGVLCVLYFEVSTTTNSLGLMIWVLHIVYGNLIQSWPLDYCLLQWVRKIFHTGDYTAFWNSGVCSSAHKFRPNSLIEEQPKKKKGCGNWKINHLEYNDEVHTMCWEPNWRRPRTKEDSNFVVMKSKG